MVWYRYLNIEPNPFTAHLKRALPVTANKGQYLSTFYAEFCEAIDRLDPSLGRVIFYDDLPSDAWEVIAPHFGLSLTEKQMISMKDAARLYSKSPHGEQRAFQSDSTQKRQRADPSIGAAADIIARPSFNRLRLQKQDR